MAKIVRIKNNKSVSDVWVGQTINVGEYFTIPTKHIERWVENTQVRTDISSGDLLVNNNIVDLNATDGWAWLGIYTTPTSVSNTNTANTTSNTDVVISTMTKTLAEGMCLCLFSSSFAVSNSGKTIYVSFYQNGSQIAGTELRIKPASTSAIYPFSFHTPINAVENDVIEVRWRVDGNTAYCYSRTLTFVYLGD